MVPATNLELKDLRLVVALAETRSVTRTGRLLHVSQSAVSHHLRGLEERLGVTLFRRDRGGLSVTAPGKRILDVAGQVLPPIAALDAELRGSTAGSARELRVSTQCLTMYHWLSQIMPAFERLWPGVEIRIEPDAAGDPRGALVEGRLDFGMCMDARADKRFIERPLLKDELVAIFSPTHPLAGRRYVEPEELFGEKLIALELAPPVQAHVKKLLFPKGTRFTRVVRVPLTDTMLELVAARLGFGIIAKWAVLPQVKRGSLSAVRIGRSGVRRTWRGVYRRSSALAEPIEALMGLLAAEVSAPRYR